MVWAPSISLSVVCICDWVICLYISLIYIYIYIFLVYSARAGRSCISLIFVCVKLIEIMANQLRPFYSLGPNARMQEIARLSRELGITWNEAHDRLLSPVVGTSAPRPHPSMGRGEMVRWIAENHETHDRLVGASNRVEESMDHGPQVVEPVAHDLEINEDLPPLETDDDDVEAPVSPAVVAPEGSEHGGIGRANSWRTFLSRYYRGSSQNTDGEGESTSVGEEGRPTVGTDAGEPSGLVPNEAMMPLGDEPLGDVSSSLGLPNDELVDIDQTEVKRVVSPEVDSEQVRFEARRTHMEMHGVPRVVLILCSLFWKLELLNVCNLLWGPEAPPNDDEFCRRAVEVVHRNCGWTGEKLSPESRLTVHAIDIMQQTEDQIIESVERYNRQYTHAIIMPNSFHFWELIERDLGGVTHEHMKEAANRYVRIGARLMRQDLANEVLILPFLPMGEPTCQLVPRFHISHIWGQLVDSCNNANDYVYKLLTHLWSLEMAQCSMNVPHVVAWNFIPHDPHAAWEVYVSYFNDRYERRRPITLPCSQVHCSGSHYLLHELWGLVQDTEATCECQMTVSIVRPMSNRQRRKFRACLRRMCRS